jgi:S1-C subfamily serine protease|tara:strand:+ start:129 stop:926 length:798 start_codon:yes stop_codon:yes gene_type:complete
MFKNMKLVLAVTLSFLAVSLLSFRLSGGVITDLSIGSVSTQTLLRPILYNANNVGVSIDDTVALTGATRTRRDVRRAAVEVVTASGRGSGTYFEIDGHHVVFTAAHVINNMPVVSIVGQNGETVFGTVFLTAENVDMAIVLIPELNSRTPMRYKPAKREDINDMVGEDVTYTGFPSHHDLLTIDGVIASEEDGNLVMHSYAWPGASGSGVFNMRGDFVGVVRAVDVGVWSYQVPPQLIEDMVWIAPSWGITRDEIRTHLRRRGLQ